MNILKYGLLLLASITATISLQRPVVADETKPAPIIWIDVRTAAEYEAAHLDGVINIPHNVIGEKIESVTKDRSATIYLHCRSGGRAGVALQTLKEMGYKNVTNIGGFEAAKKKRTESGK